MQLRLPPCCHLLEMSLLPTLQCLFCNHLNRVGARFCNDCGSQMHLQPCDRCGAPNKRSAKSCFKCGSGFTLPAAAPDLDAAPEFLVDQPADPALNEATVATEHTPVHPDAAPVPPEPQPADETVAAETGATATRPRRNWRVATLTALLAAIAMSLYYYSEQSAQPAKQPGKTDATQIAPTVPGAPTSADAAASSVAPPLEPASVATGSAPKLAAGGSGLGAAPPLAAPGAGAVTSVPPSVCSEQERILGLCK